MTRRLAMLCAVSTAALACGSAFAQEDDITQDEPRRERAGAIDQLTDVITVTATKSANPENVQDVPIAMTAFGEESLEVLKVRDLEDLSFSTPNVSLEDVGTSRGTANFSIRGLGVNSSIPSIDPAVGVFVDGVYLGVNTGVVFDIFDLESIELLRGPQGLLFGRNTTGGAVLINTGNPTDEFSAKARIATETPVDDGRGTWNTFVQGTVSGPIVEGKLNGKLSAYYNKDGGYFENLENGQDFGKASTYIARAALEWFPTDRLSVLGKIQYFDSDGQGPAGQNRGFFERDTFDFAIDEEGDYKSENWFGTIQANLDVDFGDGEIVNIFGYRDGDGSTVGDIDSTDRFLFHSGTEFAQDQISNELRYAGTFDKADITTGVYYFQQDVSYTETRDITRDLPFPFPDVPNPNAPPTFYGGGEQDHTVWGAFGQIDYSVTERLTATAGLRYSHEDKEGAVTYIRPRPECSVVGGTCPTSGTNPFTGEPNDFTDDDSWENFTPKFGLQYDTGEGALAYASYTKGFRSGGYNFRITDVPVFLERVVPALGGFAFDEEEVDAYELGAKFQSNDRRLTLNTALFLTEIADMQREVNVSDPGAAVVQNIVNTADARIKGFEIDGQYVISDSLLVMGNIGLIDAEYEEVLYDLTGDGRVTQADLELKLPRVPEATYGASVIHDLDLGDAGAIVSRVSYQYRDEVAYTDNNLGWIQAADMLDANIAWESPYEGVSVALYGKNLLDEVQAGNDTQLPFGGPLSTGVAEPFAFYPQGGTLAPLKKGRLIGIELILER
ncbi:TonB-dependent receptor [Parvularcula oceani]|uniref:TonB-dependent receptor n=1 Tax=Parvularcula oceani TaxID=1247963 RepID=UPI0004E13DA2|nr:TonB-dependent receptor [Parvularcula oceani]